MISVCIPTYSRLAYLQDSVASIYSQTSDLYEICISIDPGPSGPDSKIVEWCQQEAEFNNKFRYKINNTNKGLAGNWNELTNFATSDYVIIIGDDDTLQPTFIDHAVKAINIFEPDVVFTNQHFIDQNGKYLKELTEKSNIDYKRNELKEGLISKPIEIVLNNTVPMSAAVIKTTRLRKFPFDVRLNTPEQEVFLKIALDDGKFVYIDKQLANYRVHTGSATSSGLRIHYYVENLIKIDVPEEYEPIKYSLISNSISTAINTCIRQGDTKLGNFLLNCKYYPNNRPAYKFIQRLLLYSPRWLKKYL